MLTACPKISYNLDRADIFLHIVIHSVKAIFYRTFKIEERIQMKISVLGTGYVGLVAGTCFAESGNQVLCADTDRKKIGRLRQGHCPIYEPGLETMLQWNMQDRRLGFTADLKQAVRFGQIIFIAVGTPMDQDGSCDLSFYDRAARTIGQYLDGYKIIVNKSTVPVGTAERVKKIIRSLSRKPFDVVSNPEFLKEGTAVEDFLRPDRVIIGSSSTRATKMMKELYAPFVRNFNPIMEMDIRSAELTKYAANAFLATKISFINEIANLCEKVGADVYSVRAGIGSDSRIGNKFLYPGVGYGGSCFPKDVKALVKTASRKGMDLKILRAVDDVNQRQKIILLDKIERHFKNQIAGKSFAVWGLAFKANTDDVRESAALVLIEELLRRGARITVYDPKAMDETRKVFHHRIEYAPHYMDALTGAHGLIILTEWSIFRRISFDLVRRRLKSPPVIFDGRNLFEPEIMRREKIRYYCIGRK
jgi:UDPglucose 6-dehydrogenase